ncbi:MAG: DoxX-like family protein [Sphingomonadales bacterium]|nr:DoxX-like family protein [Sphingomonadales bacterium]
MARPAGTQDLWQARLYLMKPLIRLTLAAIWLGSAALSLLTPAAHIFALVPALPEPLALALGRGGGLVDLALGLALLRNWRPRATALAQLAVVGGYTIGLSALAPGLWLDPIGGVLKNLGILALIATHLALAEER